MLRLKQEKENKLSFFCLTMRQRSRPQSWHQCLLVDRTCQNHNNLPFCFNKGVERIFLECKITCFFPVGLTCCYFSVHVAVCGFVSYYWIICIRSTPLTPTNLGTVYNYHTEHLEAWATISDPTQIVTVSQRKLFIVSALFFVLF